MSKIKIVMVYSDNCIHCKKVKPIVEKFVSTNGKFIDFVQYDAKDYISNPIYGKVDGFPSFFFINKKSVCVPFDFVDERLHERTYNELKNVITKLHIN